VPTIGLVVNPRSGSDVRRVVAAAGSSTLDEKANIVRRVVLAAREVAPDVRFVHHGDPHAVVRRATETMRGASVEQLDLPLTFTEHDSVLAAAAMRAAGCDVVVVLGGDGTNRAVAKGWPDVPVIPLSTGTNNAFPVFVEPTVAGAAAGLIAAGAVPVGEVARTAKVVRVEIEGEDPDVALVDAVAVGDRFVGSLELFDPDTMRLAVLTRADPAAIGFAAVGGLLDPVGEHDEHGLLLRFAPVASRPALVVHAPTAPGHYADVGVAEVRRLRMDEPVVVGGLVLLAFDGERKRRLGEGVAATLRVRRDGPRVVDVAAVLHRAAADGRFVRRID
jgi:hypothetical protein